MAERGQPKKYTAEELRGKVEEYFTLCRELHRMPTMTGLALHLDYYSERALYRYIEGAETDKKSPSRAHVEILTRARERIKEENIQALYDKDRTRGAQFVLQNGFGYTTKQEIQQSEVITVKLTDD